LESLQHDHSNSTPILLIGLVLAVDTTVNVCSSPVEEVEVQLAITGTEFLLLKEERIVHERETVEDVEAELLGEDQGIGDQLVQSHFEVLSGASKGGLGGIVVQVSGTDGIVFPIADDGRF